MKKKINYLNIQYFIDVCHITLKDNAHNLDTNLLTQTLKNNMLALGSMAPNADKSADNTKTIEIDVDALIAQLKTNPQLREEWEREYLRELYTFTALVDPNATTNPADFMVKHAWLMEQIKKDEHYVQKGWWLLLADPSFATRIEAKINNNMIQSEDIAKVATDRYNTLVKKAERGLSSARQHVNRYASFYLHLTIVGIALNTVYQQFCKKYQEEGREEEIHTPAFFAEFAANASYNAVTSGFIKTLFAHQISNLAFVGPLKEKTARMYLMALGTYVSPGTAIANFLIHMSKAVGFQPEEINHRELNSFTDYWSLNALYVLTGKGYNRAIQYCQPWLPAAIFPEYTMNLNLYFKQCPLTIGLSGETALDLGLSQTMLFGYRAAKGESTFDFGICKAMLFVYRHLKHAMMGSSEPLALPAPQASMSSSSATTTTTTKKSK